MRVFANTIREIKTTFNVLAETKSGNANNVVMVGGHLDSVFDGPGINDNGSGSAAILDVAEAMQKVKPTNKVRFAWWGAEESGLVGSTFYVASLSPAEQDQIALYLNFDMIGSPNYVRFVYDGSGDIGPAGPAGSAAIEDFFNGFYAARGLASEPTAFDGRSDYGPFIARGGRHPGRRPVHRRRGHQDGGPTSRVRGLRGPAVRPLLPRRLRHLQQQQRRGAGSQRRRHRRRDPHLRHEHTDGQRGLADNELQGQRAALPAMAAR